LRVNVVDLLRIGHNFRDPQAKQGGLPLPALAANHSLARHRVSNAAEIALGNCTSVPPVPPWKRSCVASDA
jgi:hypothetical protein